MYLYTLFLIFYVSCSSIVPPPKSYYDFIVVGSGIGGSTLALELSKLNHSVLLIELGPKYISPNVSVPLFYPKAWSDENIHLDYKVNFYSEERSTDLSEYRYIRSGGLGGCSLNNVMISMLPNTKDFDLMVEMTGDNSWSEKRIREKYLKSMSSGFYNEKFVNEVAGLIPITYKNLTKQFELDSKLQQISDTFLPKKFVDVNGYDEKGRLNLDNQGKILMPSAIDPNTFNRLDIVRRIEQHQKYKLDVWTDTLVTKVLLDKNNRAVGINYSKGKYLYNPSPKFNKDNLNNMINGTIKVNKEVILSGGAFNSPQLLMLSGIGPKRELEKFNIPVKVDLPGVGKNLMDKDVVLLTTTFNSEFSIFTNCTFTLDDSDICYQQFLNRSGPYTSNWNVAGHLLKSKPELDSSDLFLVTGLLSTKMFDFKSSGKGMLTSPIFKSKSKSKGYLKLNSKSPYQQLHIQFNKFGTKESKLDLKVLKRVVKLRTQQLNSLTNSTTNLDIHQDMETFIRNHITGFHVCCTNKIGKKGDKKAVLDSRFQVRGTEGLRVVDASSFSTPPGYFPATFTYILAIKVSEYIDMNYRICKRKNMVFLAN